MCYNKKSVEESFIMEVNLKQEEIRFLPETFTDTFLDDFKRKSFFFFLLHPNLSMKTKYRYYQIIKKMDGLKELDTVLLSKLYHRLLRIDQSPSDIEKRISMFMGALSIAIHTQYILFLDIENFIKTAYELDQANIYLDQMDDYSCFIFDEDTKNKSILKTKEDYVMRKK